MSVLPYRPPPFRLPSFGLPSAAGRAGVVAVFLAVLLVAPGLAAQPAVRSAGQPSAPEPPAAESATPPWDVPFADAPAAIARAAAALPPADEGARVLLEEETYTYREDGSHEYRRRLVYHLQSQALAEAWASVVVAWHPWHEERPQMKARVIAPSGAERWLDPATLTEEPLYGNSPEILSDARGLRAPLPGVGVGSVVESEVVVCETAPLSAAGVVESFIVGFGVPTSHSRLVVSLPETLPFEIRTQLLDGVEPLREAADGRVTWRFEIGPSDPADDVETYLPPEVPAEPRIAWATGRSWADVAATYAAQVETQIADADRAGGEVAERVAAALAGLDDRGDRDAVIAALVADLHGEVRYTGLELGEAALVPRRPAEVLARGYGDCKDKSALLVALLRAAGIDAELALLRTGPGQDVDPDLPGLGAFDHAVVHVPAADDAGSPDGAGGVWIDATAEAFPPGLLPAQAQGRRALLARPSGGRLVTTPATTSADNREIVHREVWMAELGKGRLVEGIELSGLSAAQARGALEGLNAEELDEAGRSFAAETWNADDVVDWHPENLGQPTLPMWLRSEVEGVGLVITEVVDAVVVVDNGYVLTGLPWLLREPSEDDDGEADEESPWPRQHDMVLDLPYACELHYRIHPPPGYVPQDLPDDETRQLGPATYSLHGEWQPGGEDSPDGGVLELTLRFDTGGRRYTPGEAQELRDGVREIFDAGNLLIAFDSEGEALLAAGLLPQALHEFHRLEAAYPDSPVQRSRVSRALVEAGVGEAARQRARRGAELAPDAAVAHKTLGYVLLHDLAGRQLVAGWDREGAIAALTRAAELDPDDSLVHHNLAVCYERNDDAQLYGEGSDLEAALEQYRYLYEQAEDASMNEPYLSALMQAGHYDDAIELARDLPPSALVLGNLVAAVAATKGTVAALREARSIEGDLRQQALAGAGQRLMLLRRYPEAAEMLRSAARGAPNPSMVLGLAASLEETVRHEDLSFEGGTPEDASISMLMDVWNGDEDALRHHFRWLLARVGDGEESAEDFMAGVEHGMEAARQQGVDPNLGIDLTLSSSRLVSEGDDETGWRVSMESLGGANVRLYLIAEPDGYQFVALVRLGDSSELAGAGWYVLDLVEAGRLEAARQWLDWAREEVTTLDADDPVLEDPFTGLWTRGQQGDAAALRRAAAALILAGDDEPDEALAILEEARAEMGDEASGPALVLDSALARGYGVAERWADLETVSRRLCAAYPRSELAHNILAVSLVSQERVDELAELAQGRLAADPDDRGAWILAYNAALARGDLETASSWLRRRIDAGIATSTDYNQIAWFALYRDGGPGRDALELAHLAVEKSNSASAAALHTLASVYAELDEPVAARDVLQQSLELKDGIEEHDWYVLGRIAESYGETEAAADAYRRLEEPEEERAVATSTWRLAQRRLAALTAPAETSPEPAR